MYSLYLQTRPPEEIIVALSEADELAGRGLAARLSEMLPVVVVATEQKQTAGENRNRGAQIAQGSVVSFIDADDISHPQRLEIIATAFEKWKPKMVLHSYLRGHARFEQYDPELITAITSEEILSVSGVTPETRDRAGEIAGRVPTNLGCPDGTPIHHGHGSVDRTVFSSIQFCREFPQDDGIFARDVLMAYRETIVVRAALTAYFQSN